MPAGLNLKVNVWRYTETDDDVGGSVPSGTMIYQNASGRRINRLFHLRYVPGMESVAQGIESGKFDLFELCPATMGVIENDEIEIVNPPNNWDCGKRFRVISIMREGYHPADPRGTIAVSCKRSTIAHAIQ
jgi:hypothetical protein